MKAYNSHLFAWRSLRKFPRFPNNPKVVVLGSPQVGLSTFAQRLAVDLGVPAISMKDIYKSILSMEEHYSSETFYRKVISLLKDGSSNDITSELENNMIPEKLLTLAKYSELGFVLYDYPNSIRQCEKYY